MQPDMSNSEAIDIELADQASGLSEVEDTRSSFSERERRRRVSHLSNGNDTSNRPIDSTSSTGLKPQHSLLEIFRLLQQYKIQIFSIEPDQRWNIRPELGKGASFAVEEAGLSISSTLSHLQYRSLDVKGPNEASNFVDHTNTAWSRDAPVAFKSVGSDPGQISDLVTELRVLCHPPLQQHPHIVKLLGVVLVMEQNPRDIQVSSVDQTVMEWEPQEMPMVVVEKAPHASLSVFLSSIEFCDIPSSLKAKLSLCADVLDAIQALHSCQILHGDVKCDNVLVFKNSRSTAQNWTAKIVDFGHSVLKINDESMNERPSDFFAGSPFYCPPELTCSPEDFSPSFVKGIDIWCWGMLLWEVLTNGTGTKDYELNDMHELREQGLVLTTAKENCVKFLNTKHGQESGLFGAALEALDGSLHPDPSQRLSATNLLQSLKRTLQERLEYTISPSEPESIESLPFFDITRLHYNLSSFATIPNRIYNELQKLKDKVNSECVLDATYQMGLCSIAGFGTDRDFEAAMELVMNAANGHHQQAMAVALPLANALGINLLTDERRSAEDFARKSFRRGTTTAMWDRGILTSELYESIQDNVGYQRSGLPTSLLMAIRQGRYVGPTSTWWNTAAVSSRGDCGDSPLHWATVLPGMESANLVRSLLNAGAEVESATFKECPISDFPNGTDIMPANTTALEWAVIIDNLEAVLVMEEWMRRDGANVVSKSALTRTTTLLSYAAQYQSMRCLDHFCKVCKEDEMNSFDSRGFSPFYFAVRPDIFGRVLRYDSSISSSVQENAPFIAREAEVMNKLREAGSNLVVHSQNFFNCLHVAAAQGGLEVLDHLLQIGGKDLLNECSKYGWTPLKDAITRGNVEAFQLLLEKGADTQQVWKQHSSLHLCCMFQGTQAVEMASKLLEDDRSALDVRNHEYQTPLHTASHYGHVKLIDLFVSKGARLLDTLSVCLNPLGVAIRSRHVLAVALLSSKHREQNTVLMAGKGIWIVRLPLDMRLPIPIGGRYVSALEYLLTPGCHSPNAAIKHGNIPLQTDWSLLGCCDIPISKASLKIVDVLLRYYKHKYRFGINFYLSSTYPVYRYDSGLRWAVRMSNLEAVEHILAAHNDGRSMFDPDLRDLIELACSQLLHGMSHVGSAATRLNLAEYLKEKQIEEFQSIRERRTHRNPSPLLRQLWATYYNAYACMEQAQYERAVNWQLKVRPCTDPRFLEFRQWHSPRLSIYIFIYFSLWALLLPTIICYAIIARDPSSHISSGNLACVIVMIILVNGLSLWPKVFRILCVLFDRACKDFPGNQWAMGWVQFALCLLFIGVAVLEMWLLDPDRTKLIRFGTGYPGEAGASPADLPPGRRDLLSSFQALCQALMAWIVLAQVIPPILVVWNRFVRYIDGGISDARRSDLDAPVLHESKRTYEFRSRLPTSAFL